MGRLLAIDYGLKRTGLAVTDPLKIIATALTTVATKDLMVFLKEYTSNEEVESFIVGMPVNLEGKDTDSTASVRKFVENLNKNFPQHSTYLEDERFTSKIAMDAMIEGGKSKSYRRNKSNIDQISAVLILQSFMERSET
jgi:putative holliday junction resolvase